MQFTIIHVYLLWHMFLVHVWKIVLNLSIYWGRQLHCFVLVYTICQQILMTPHNMRRNTKRIVPISYHFSYVILFVRPMRTWHVWHLKSLWPINLIRLWIRLSIKVIRGWVQRVVIFPHNYLELYASFTIMRLIRTSHEYS